MNTNCKHTFRQLFLFCISFLLITKSYSQKQGNIWYFGHRAGLSFSSGSPSVLNNGQIYTDEGVASICDNNGRLLFYTDGITIWDQKHDTMPGGKGLFGHFSASQSAVIVPKPRDSARYYVFTVDHLAGSKGLCYSIVNMNLNGGYGDVEVKNIPLKAPVCEKITAVNHCNGQDVWVITHGWNSNTFFSYLATPSGVSALPVTSNSGRVVSGLVDRSIGCMKASPDGSRLALAHNLIGADLFDFNTTTGVVSNPVDLQAKPRSYGMEFSPNSTLLYVSSYYYDSNDGGDLNSLYQYEVTLPTSSQIINSKKVIHKTEDYITQVYGSLQLAADGKMYLAQFNQAYLSAINDPDSIGAACHFSKNAIQLNPGQLCRFGLPTFVQSFWQGDFSYSGACESQTIQFNYTKPTNITSVKWDFGDPSSGVNNTSWVMSPSHIYANDGTYIVKLIRFSGCGSDTLVKEVQAGKLLFTLGSDTSLCGTTSFQLNPQLIGQYSYLWQDSSTNSTFNATSSGIHWVEVENRQTHCKRRDSIQLVFNPLPLFDLGTDISRCEGQAVTLSSGILGSHLWNNGSVSASQIVSQSGLYWVDVTVNNCTRRDSVWVNFYDYPQVNLGNDTTLCESETLELDAGNTGAQYSWQNGNTTQTLNVGQAGNYFVKVTKNNCASSDSIMIAYNYKPLFTLGENKTICQGQSIQLKPQLQSGNSINYTWQDGSIQPLYNVTTPGFYHLTAVNECGTVLDSVLVEKGVCNLYVPSAFTPNGDGKNDIFRTSFAENLSRFSLQVFNRWGQKIFESKEVTFGWDGKHSGVPQSSGAYIWLIRYTTTDNPIEQILNGTVMLIR